MVRPSHKVSDNSQFTTKTWIRGYRAGGLLIEGLEVLDARARVEHYYALALIEGALIDHFSECRQAGRSFRCREDAGRGSDLADSGDELSVGNRDGRAARCANRVENQEVADRLWNTQAGSNRGRIFEFVCKTFAQLECTNDRRAG